jgi:hypothetical protein
MSRKSGAPKDGPRESRSRISNYRPRADSDSRYKKAYDAMVACPITFEHPSEALQLNGLGPKLCDFLLERLKTHNLENGLPPPTLPRKGETVSVLLRGLLLMT